MTHAEQNVLRWYGIGKAQIDGAICSSIGLTHGESIQLKSSLHIDSINELQKSVQSFCTALDALKRGSTTWPIVMLYYSMFYGIRSHLYGQGIALLREKRSVWELTATFEARATKLDPSDHESAIKAYMKHTNDVLLRNAVILDDVNYRESDCLVWMKSMRNYVSYRVASFKDPEHPACIRDIWYRVVRNGAPRLLSDVSTDWDLYCVDPAFAVVAIPWRIIYQNIRRSARMEVPQQCYESYERLLRDMRQARLPGLE